MFSDSFAGIAPSSVPGFVLAQFLGAGLAVVVHKALTVSSHSSHSSHSSASSAIKAKAGHD